MQAIYRLCFLLIAIGGTALAGVGNKDLDNIRALTAAGQYQQALEKHLWFHEESKSSAGMAGVRLSFAISAWIELGQKYPPAIQALTRIRDNDREVLLSGNGGFGNFHDLSAINSGLGDDENTLQLFLLLDKKFPGQAKAYYIVAENLLIRNKQYHICAKYIGDPIIKFEGLRHSRELNLSLAKTNSEMSDAFFLEFADKNYIEGVITLIEVLVAINKRAEAEEVQQRAMSYFTNERIENALR